VKSGRIAPVRVSQHALAQRTNPRNEILFPDFILAVESSLARRDLCFPQLRKRKPLRFRRNIFHAYRFEGGMHTTEIPLS
jgi:hypothetical protein